MNRQWLKYGLVFGALASVMGAGYYFLKKKFLPQTRGNLKIQGLVDPVEVIRDRWGIPHIFARSETDLIFAQGFIHAQDRLWQMDFHRRLVAGRLAEVLGEVALPADRWMRILGMRRLQREMCPCSRRMSGRELMHTPQVSTPLLKWIITH